MSESPLHVNMLKARGAKRHILDTSDEESDGLFNRLPEVLHNDMEDTPCDSSRPSTSTYGCTPDGTVHGEMVIELTHQEEEAAWCTEEEEEASETSTPDFKRGRHNEGRISKLDRKTDTVCDGIETVDSGTNEQAKLVQLIEKEGLKFQVPKWISRRRPPTSILVLADSRLEDWPWSDKICQVEYFQGRGIGSWASRIRDGEVCTKAHTVVMYLEGLRTWGDAPPMKNCLQSISTALRQKHPGCRIFISNLLPHVCTSPIGPTVSDFNYTLMQATCSVSRAIGKVYVLSAFEHFLNKKNKARTSTQYFKPNDQLTRMGCLIVCEIFMHETGIKSYWFDDDTDQGK